MNARLGILLCVVLGASGCLDKSESNVTSDPGTGSPPPPASNDRVNLQISLSGSGAVSDPSIGLSCATSCTIQVDSGTSVVLSASADVGFAFDGWGGQCSGTGSCQIVVSQNTSISARFSAVSRTPPSGASLHLEISGSGTIPVTLHPGSTVTPGAATKVAFGVPFPKGLVFSTDQLRISDAQGNEIASAVSELGRWRTIPVGNEESIRFALFYVDVVFADRAPTIINVEYGQARTMTLAGTQPGVQTLWTSISNGPNPDEFPAADDIREPTVYATLPASWLGDALLITRTIPVDTAPSLQWWDTGLVGFGHTAVNEVAPTVLPQNRIDLSTSEPWLYDRALTLFGVYARTGDVSWLRHAHRAAQWYAKNVDANGIFTRASYNHDLKYSYGQSLLVDYALTGDSSLTAPIGRVAEAGVREWETTYSTSVGFWTERHHTYAILAALSAFELTGSTAQAARATELVNLTLQMSANEAHCPLHTVEQHEGDAGDTRMMCSPWMEALLASAMLRYYAFSGDDAVLYWLAGVSDFLDRYAVYDGGIEDPQLAGRMMPWYLVGPTGRIEDGRGWGDMEHTCDVAGLAAKGAWAKRRLGLDSIGAEVLADELLATCEFVLDYWHRSTPELAEYRLTPPRKFSWWFGSSADLAWMLGR